MSFDEIRKRRQETSDRQRAERENNRMRANDRQAAADNTFIGRSEIHEKSAPQKTEARQANMPAFEPRPVAVDLQPAIARPNIQQRPQTNEIPPTRPEPINTVGDDDEYDADRYDSARGWDPHEKAKKKYKKQIDAAAQERAKQEQVNNILFARPVNEIIESAEAYGTSRKLFGELWGEQELNLLFSDTGVGKSAFGVQLAENIARGLSVAPLENTADSKSVLYIDLELSDRQFISRYSARNSKGKIVARYPFADGVIRATLDLPWGDNSGWSEIGFMIGDALMHIASQQKIPVIIIDNLSYLLNSLNGIGPAVTLLKTLKVVRDIENVSILALCHTPKRNEASPLTLNDLMGTKMLSNFADNIFALGRSSIGPNVRYLKQIKQRNTALEFGANNVIDFLIERVPGPAFETGQTRPVGFETPGESCFLNLTHTGYSDEDVHLLVPERPALSRENLVKRAGELYREGCTMSAIANVLGLSRSTAHRYVEEARKLRLKGNSI